MRATTTSLSLLAATLAACGGSPPAVIAPAPPPTAVVAVEPVAPPVPAEPAGLLTPSAPYELCAITGAIGDDRLELAGRDEGAAFAIAIAGQGKISVGKGGRAFAVITTPSFTVRGILPRGGVHVRTRRWVAFGGVYFPGARAPLELHDARDGKLVVGAPEVPGFTLEESQRTAEIACGGASLAIDADGVLGRELPPPFVPQGKPSAMLFKATTPIPVSAEPTGPVMGTFEPAATARPVTVLEQRGARSRVRRGHVAGWVDTKLLVAPKKVAPPAHAEFGMIGLLSSGVSAAPSSDDADTKDDKAAPSSLVCAADVRVVAELAEGGKQERFAIGTISAGKPVRITDKDPSGDLVYLAADASDGLNVQPDARLAVPARDLQGCTTDTKKPATRAAAAPSAPSTPTKRDAIDALEPASTSAYAVWSGDAIGDSSGAGGLGLSGLGQGGGGEGISSANFGEGFGTGTFHAGGGTASGAPVIRQGATQVNGRLPPEVIQRIVRQNFGRYRACYQIGLNKNPKLEGRIAVKFGIDRSGNATDVGDAGSTIEDAHVVSCVLRSFANLSFPQPEGGVVTVVYPIIFAPGTPAKATPPKPDPK